MKKMKITVLLFLMVNIIGYSQSTSTSVSENNALTLHRITGSGGSGGVSRSYGQAMRFVNPPKAIDGSIYLFKKWKGSPAVIESKDKKTFVLDNINFNLKTNRFVTKISQDSIFVINMDKIDNINILGKVFKKIDSEIGTRIFEVVFESDKISILNFHSVKLVEGSVNPMLGRKKIEIENKNQELVREHEDLKHKIKNLMLEVKKRSEIEDNFNQEIEELSKETESLVSDIEKWQT